MQFPAMFANHGQNDICSVCYSWRASLNCARSEGWVGHLTNYSTYQVSGKGFFKGCRGNGYAFHEWRTENQKAKANGVALFEQK